MTTLSEYKAMMEGATDAPWSISRRADTAVAANGERGICSTGGYADNRRNPDELSQENKSNAQFISASRNLAPELIRVIELAEDAILKMMEAHGDVHNEQISYAYHYAEQALSEIRKLRGE